MDTDFEEVMIIKTYYLYFVKDYRSEKASPLTTFIGIKIVVLSQIPKEKE